MGKVALLAIRAQRRKKPFEDPRVLRDQILAERRSVTHPPPRSLARRVSIRETTIRGRPCYTLSPLGGRDEQKRRIFFLHGGCYVFEIVPEHWHFVARLVEVLHATVTVPIYPLAPEAGYRDAHEMVLEAYRALAKDTSADRIALMGDSAGGGMALALAQSINKNGLPRPADIVLLSPWLDVTMTNPDITEIEPRDPWLARPGLVEAGRMYAQGDDPKGSLVSPIYGELEGLGRISIFIGTRDILLADARKLHASAKDKGIDVQLYESEGMFHDWMFAPIPEAKETLASIAQILARVRA